MSDLVGCRVGDYQVLRRLGSGGMADVYAAKHLKLRRDAALKVLRRNPQNGQEDVKRFEREAQAAARLNHSSIVQVYEIGHHEGNHFIAQELVDGVNLKQWLQQDGQLSSDDAINVLRSVAEALAVAHAAGVTHRDIKPENVMRAEDGAIKVTDFGLARMLSTTDASSADLTRAGLTLGTPRYMSPEQIQGHTVDGRSDLYSLGVTMYHLLAGQPPFDAEEPLALAVKHLHEMPKPLDHARGASDLPSWLVAVVMRLLRKAPEDRFESAADLLLVIHQNTDSSPTASAPGAVGATATMASSADIAGARSAAISGYSTGADPLGTTSATIQLQRVTDALAIDQRRDRWRWGGMIAMVLACATIGWGAMHLRRPPTVARAINAPWVKRAATIQDQYWEAITLNSVAGWQAVQDYFPADEVDTNDRVYHLKANLQLTRLLMEEKRWPDASRTLERVEKSGEASRLYQALAMVMRCQICEAMGKRREFDKTKSALANLIREMEDNQSAALESFRAVVPVATRIELNLEQPAVVDGPSSRTPGSKAGTSGTDASAT